MKFLEDICFRSTVLASLITVASIFILRSDGGAEISNKKNGSSFDLLGIGAESWTAIFTAGLFFATIGLFFATYALFKTAAQESNKAEEALAIARTSAEASLRQAEAAVAVGRAHLRVHWFRLEFGNLLSEAHEPFLGKPYMRWDLKNYGPTPAEITEISVKITIDVSERATDYMFLDWRPKTIGPGEILQSPLFDFTAKVPSDSIIRGELIRKQRYLWAGMRICYVDVFENSHVEEVIWQLVKHGSLSIPRVAFRNWGKQARCSQNDPSDDLA